MLPQHLIVEFWSEVRERLANEYHLEGTTGSDAINDYIARARKHDFEEMIYHRNPEEVARTIAGGVKRGGFEDPVRSEPR